MNFFQTHDFIHEKKAEILGFPKLLNFFVHLFSAKSYIILKMNKFVMNDKHWKIGKYISQTCCKNAFIQAKIYLQCIKV